MDVNHSPRFAQKKRKNPLGALINSGLSGEVDKGLEKLTQVIMLDFMVNMSRPRGRSQITLRSVCIVILGYSSDSVVLDAISFRR